MEDRLQAIEIIKKMYKGEPTKEQNDALELAYSDMKLRIKKLVTGKLYMSDGNIHFRCPHCGVLIQPKTSEKVCCFCGGELSWSEEIKKGSVVLV